MEATLPPDERPRGERCGQPSCGDVWPQGTLTAVDVTDAKGKRRVKMCPRCVEALVRRADQAAGGKCGTCTKYQPGGLSQEGDAIGGCAFHQVPVAADDDACDTPGAYQQVR
jgi:ribosomal protein S27AE